jgi:signal peptidase I
MTDTSLKSMTYRGPSMNPIFKTGDILEIIKYDSNSIKCGDVVVFQSPRSNRKITHRVVSNSSQGIRTRGDNVLKVDEYILTIDDIMGKVISIRRGKKKRRIHGGVRGQLYAGVIKVMRRFDYLISKILHYPYYLIVRSGIFSHIFPLHLNTRVLYFKRESGLEMKLVWGKYIIGRIPAGKDKWIIKRPFRLFIDVETLPNRAEHLVNHKNESRIIDEQKGSYRI